MIELSHEYKKKEDKEAAFDYLSTYGTITRIGWAEDEGKESKGGGICAQFFKKDGGNEESGEQGKAEGAQISISSAQLREQAREEGDSEGGDPVAAALRFVGGDDVEEAIEAYKARSELLDAADELLDPANAQVHLHDAWEQRCVDAQV